MLAIEESQKLTLSNLPSLSLFTGTDQGQFEVMKSQVLKWSWSAFLSLRMRKS